MPFIEKNVDSELGIITLADSDNGNRLNVNSLEKLDNALDEFINNGNVRAVLIRSNGNNFCLGMDLNFAQDEHDNEQRVKKSIDLYSGILKKIHSCSKAVIALINGDVKAGGLGLISACDIIICSDKSTFELSEVLFGLIPANVLPFLFSLRLSPQKVRYLVISATKINAKEAHQIGLIDEFYEEELLEKALKRLLKTIFRASPDAIKQIKNFTSEIHNETFESRIEIAKQKLTQILTDKKVINAIKSFNQGDIPDWFSKFKPVGKLVL